MSADTFPKPHTCHYCGGKTSMPPVFYEQLGRFVPSYCGQHQCIDAAGDVSAVNGWCAATRDTSTGTIWVQYADGSKPAPALTHCRKDLPWHHDQ